MKIDYQYGTHDTRKTKFACVAYTVAMLDHYFFLYLGGQPS